MLISGVEAPRITCTLPGRSSQKKSAVRFLLKRKIKSNHHAHLHTCTNQVSNTYINKHGMHSYPQKHY